MQILNDKVLASTQALLDQATELRKESLLSQKQVATILGLSSHASINAIESKKSIPRIDTFLKVLSVYGYTLHIVPMQEDSE